MLELKILKRDKKENLEEIREGGKLPAVFYGKKEKTTSIIIESIEFKKVWDQAGGSELIVLKGLGEDKEVLIKDIDMDPIKYIPRHIDFYVVEKGKKIETNVPLEFIGVSPAVKSLGGILIKVMRELSISVLPKDLPKQINVELGSLENLDSLISIKDLKLPEGVEVLNNPDEIVASISGASDSEEESSSEMDISQIEAEKKGKAEETEK
jgi:large subunit ribosomal protein L25